MKLIRTVADMRDERAAAHSAGATVGFVPTMGALHEGHLSLVDAAREGTESVVMSVFVNPLQFGPGEDFDAYPRDEERDAELAEQRGVHVFFAPTVEEIHPPGRTTNVSVRGMVTSVLEGALRPGHFDGVTTVVSSLLHIVDPDVAFFGQKDAQQLAVIRKMTRDLSFRTEIVACPTIRDPDGLALSSRNAYLSPQQRAAALSLRRALDAGAAAFSDAPDAGRVEASMMQILEGTEGVEPEYARVVDANTFEPPTEPPFLLVVAAKVGRARLIDNQIIA